MSADRLWLAPPTQPTLLQDQAHLWLIRTERLETQVERLGTTLCQAEWERAGRFQFARDREQFILGRGILRTILGRYLHQEPRALRFRYNEFGKPMLDAPAPDNTLCFNLAHSAQRMLLAITRGKKIGVDIERIRPEIDLDRLAAQIFSLHERESWNALAPDVKPRAFFNGWTRKEAFVKAVGEGLSYPLQELEVTLAPNDAAKLLRVRGDARAAEEWHMQALDVGKEYAAAYAINARDCSMQRFLYNTS